MPDSAESVAPKENAGGWDADRVAIELGAAMQTVWTDDHWDMKACQEVCFWPMKDGKRVGRKPAARLIADTRTELLRILADWIDQEDDLGFRKLIARTKSALTDGYGTPSVFGAGL